MEEKSQNKRVSKPSKHITIGLLAHVDAGKTTLSEAMLYLGGELQNPGRVDHGNAFLDNYTLERERGITIFSKQAAMTCEETEFVLLDTPGHVDFSAEMERTLQVLDYAVLVISASDGIQGHTKTLWKLLENWKVPVFLFINKMDLPGANREQLLDELSTVLSTGCIDFTSEDKQQWMENISLCDERLLDRFLEDGELQLPEDARMPIRKRQIFPCYFGSALNMQGVKELMQGLSAYTMEPLYKDEFSARVYKISRDEAGNRLTHMKITGGKLSVKDRLAQGEKVNQIRRYSGDKYDTLDVACAGEICAVTGLDSTRVGQGLGSVSGIYEGQLEPVLNVKVEFPPETNLVLALQQMRQLEEEDPKLHVVWNERQQQISVRSMGNVQLEVLQQILADRFGLVAEFGEGDILYRETIKNIVEGVGHFEPLRHYAEVHLRMEPLPVGSGLVFDTECSEDDLALNWQRLVLTHLREKEHIGVLTGAPITDMKITLTGGRAHLKHTEGGDFRQAVYRAVRQGLMQAKNMLLEPWYRFSMELPVECVGRAMTDIKRMSGDFEMGEGREGISVLLGNCPVSTMKEYPVEFASYTRGNGQINCTFGGYRPCHNEEEVVAESGYLCEEDVENTPDSVFCAHGSGFVVKWNQVHEYMHIENKLQKMQPSIERAAKKVTSSTEASRDYGAEDRELQAIFERTFGPVKQRQASSGSRVIQGSPERTHVTIKEHIKVEEYLLVDGYNIIFAWDDLKELSEVSMDAARTRLMDLMCNYQGYTNCQLILVFDAYKVKGNPGSVEQYHNISVVYTKEAETADMYIEKTTKRIARKYRVRVATSDAMEQMIILGHGALRISARAFREEVERVNEKIRLLLEERGEK